MSSAGIFAILESWKFCITRRSISRGIAAILSLIRCLRAGIVLGGWVVNTFVFRYLNKKKSGDWGGQLISPFRWTIHPGNRVFTVFLKIRAVWFDARLIGKVRFNSLKSVQLVVWENSKSLQRIATVTIFTDTSIKRYEPMIPFAEIVFHTIIFWTWRGVSWSKWNNFVG